MGARFFAARGAAVSAIAAMAALFGASGALAATTASTDSTNWSGYAVHGNGVTYRTVQGSWRQPGATCVRGSSTYSSYWVGIGGYSQSSQALEQIGTETDCSAAGQHSLSAWYELVPANAVDVKLTVHAGDLITAKVTVDGKRVAVSLYDATRRQGFSKTLTASVIDVTSTEWIVEAPSECIGQSACQTLPLANFGSAAFTGAAATSSTDHTGGISDPAWQATKIRLVPANDRVFISRSGTASLGVATPSQIGADGDSFKVTYSRISAPTVSQLLARASSAPRAANLRHRARLA
jgi:Peptidase A4 family